MLDDENILRQRDPSGALAVAAREFAQLAHEAVVQDADNDGREITSLVVTGMGGSALAALLLKVWLKDTLAIPFEIIRGYNLPNYVGAHTLVIASSYSGNTEETVSALAEAEARGAQVAILASGGKLIEEATAKKIAHVELPTGLQPRMAVFYGLRAIVALLENFDVVEKSTNEQLVKASEWLEGEAAQWAADIPMAENYAKQLAFEAVGKTPVFYGGPLTAPVAYKWKISWNETAKNLAFWNEYSEFNHNEFMGWTSHPVEKPFVVFDLISNFEHPQILKRFEISDRLLSGQRPRAHKIELKGDSIIVQLLWASILADFASIYTAILNNVDPVPVPLIEKLKKELVS